MFTLGILKKRDANHIYKSIAKAEGVSVSQIKQEMTEAIEQAKNSDDLEIRAKFKKLFGDRTPTPEEFVLKMTKKL